MTEIEKLFENANIKQDRMCEWTCKDRETCNLNCKHYGSMQLYYPPFTAEKQLKIIEWFISNRCWLNLKSLDKTLDFSLDFDEKLAKLVNRLWESFYDQEKEEIRNILNA